MGFRFGAYRVYRVYRGGKLNVVFAMGFVELFLGLVLEKP